ncbi:MAG TPA: TonB-dependent receptor [Vicinamibacterales bacterium]|nr:TonB-dependent receptor [Vicinamibacterales bacterium]
MNDSGTNATEGDREMKVLTIRGLTLALAISAAQHPAWARDSVSEAAPTTAGAGDEASPVAVDAAQAETAEETRDENATASRNPLMEEIVVTAQKREENMQDVPISIQAFSSESIVARGIENTYQLGQAVPSFQVNTVAGYALLYLRGIGTDQFVLSADQSVATYIDGIYTVQGEGVSQSLANIQRVEVLKGPQGTLFGRNSTGGAISIVTEDPSDALAGRLEGEIGSFHNRQFKASVSGPITDWLSASLSGLAARRDNAYDNAFHDVLPDETRAARGRVKFMPADSLTLTVTGSYAEQFGITMGKNTDPSLLIAALAQPVPDDYHSQTDLFPDGHSTNRQIYANLQWNLPRFDVKLLGSDQYLLVDATTVDFDGTQLPLAAFDTDKQYADYQTAELQITSNEDTWGAESFKWVAGAYYLKSEVGYDPGVLKMGAQAFGTTQTLLGQPLPAYIQELVAMLPADNTPLEEGGLTVAFAGLLGTVSHSAFGQATYYFNEWLDLTVGARFQTEKRSVLKAQTGIVDPTGGDQSSTLLRFPLQSKTAHNVSPKGVLSVHPTDESLIYLSYSVGFKSGTYNIVNVYKAPDYIKPERVATWELGFKADLLEGQIRLNGAIFNNDIDDLQSGFVSLLSGGAVRFLSVDSARTRGAEIEATALPMPDLNPGLVVSANAAYVKARYLDFTNGSGFDPVTGVYQQGLDFSGNEIVRAPKLSGGATVAQALDLGDGLLEAAVDGYHNSGFYHDARNTVREKAYNIFNARISYEYTPWQFKATVFGQNVLDERYHVQQFQTDFGTFKTLAPPHAWGLRLQWDFQ